MIHIPEEKPEQAEIPHDPKTGEIIEQERAADGGAGPWAASSLGQLVDMLERGGLAHAAYEALKAMSLGMQELAERLDKPQKGKLTLNITLKTSTGGAFVVEGDFKVTPPKEPRPKTMLWQDEKGRLMPTMPKQQILFGQHVGDHGPRVVGGSSEIRTV